ncbi:hypothetical protein BCR42DRAFT_420323 [Absidia repens]|uniref:Uncharacterized protein n=1 Tax=Absidia repens TaxID=90262 RepID=A0A1X2I9H6_9FUNG|nr:hypothetical protein BCR42DRAFT_420323 [Absidia repens]
MNIIAPCPKKPTSLLQQDWNSTTFVQQNEVDDACFELRQILQCQGSRHYCTTLRLDDPIITRTNNPLPLDSSFVPLQQQPLPQNHSIVNDTTQQQQQLSTVNRPRSLSVGVTRPVVNLVH